MKTFHKVLLYSVIGILVLAGYTWCSLYDEKEMDYRITDVMVCKVPVPDSLFREDCLYCLSISVQPVHYKHGFMIGGITPYTQGSVDSIECIESIPKEISLNNHIKCIKTVRGEICNYMCFKTSSVEECIKCYHDINSLKQGMEDGAMNHFAYLITLPENCDSIVVKFKDRQIVAKVEHAINTDMCFAGAF